jgi:ATP-dependent helicase HrpB
LLANAYPDRVAKARTIGSGDYLLANGRAASLDPTDPLAREPYLAVAEIAGRAERAQILLAAPIALADIERDFAADIAVETSVQLDKASGAVRGRRVRRYRRLRLSEARLKALRRRTSKQPWRAPCAAKACACFPGPRPTDICARAWR